MRQDFDSITFVYYDLNYSVITFFSPLALGLSVPVCVIRVLFETKFK